MSGYFLYLLLPIVLGIAAQSWTQRSVARAQRVPAQLTGAEAAAALLRAYGAEHVRVERSSDAPLSDHYDPRAGVIRLSDDIYDTRSAAAVAIAAHETGHALQHHTAQALFRLRGALAPTALRAGQLWLAPFMLGVLFGSLGLIWIAVALFGAVFVFHLVTLPVEIDASRRAMRMIREQQLLTADALPAARGALTAAASTYLVALISSAVTLLLILGTRR